MPRFSGQDRIYLSTAMGFEAGINSVKILQFMCNTGILPLSGQKSIKLECFSHRHLNRKAGPTNKGGEKKSQDSY